MNEGENRVREINLQWTAGFDKTFSKIHVNAFVGAYPYRRVPGTSPDGLLRAMTRAGIDVKAPTREGLRLAVEYLAETESSFRNGAEVEESKKKRLGWIKQVA